MTRKLWRKTEITDLENEESSIYTEDEIKQQQTLMTNAAVPPHSIHALEASNSIARSTRARADDHCNFRIGNTELHSWPLSSAAHSTFLPSLTPLFLLEKRKQSVASSLRLNPVNVSTREIPKRSWLQGAYSARNRSSTQSPAKFKPDSAS